MTMSTEVKKFWLDGEYFNIDFCGSYISVHTSQRSLYEILKNYKSHESKK